MRLNAYVTYDAQRAETDSEYRKGALNFHSALRGFGYKVIIKTVSWYTDENKNRIGKANADLDLALALARVPGLILTTFGDMLRVPGGSGSLEDARAQGALDALGAQQLGARAERADAREDHRGGAILIRRPSAVFDNIFN